MAYALTTLGGVKQLDRWQVRKKGMRRSGVCRFSVLFT